MRDKQIKLIYYSMGGSQVKDVSLGWKRLFIYSAISIISLSIIIVAFLGLFTDFFNDIQVSSLSKTNGQLQKQLQSMNEKVRTIENKIQSLEKQDDDLRIFTDLPKIDKDIRNVGVGGTVTTPSMEYHLFPDEATNKAFSLSSTLDQFERRLELAVKSRREIEKVYRAQQKKFLHTPSIRPMCGGRISDKFGYRLDPFIQKIKHHDGVDISAPRGTEVYASADGIVERAKNNYKPNHGYGKEVIINHGNGIKTRYAHLDKINVKPGQRVNRWDIIGWVGNTGRSTGPHLHYEVMANGQHKDPQLYMID